MAEDIGFYNIALEESYEDGDIIIEEGKSGDWVCVILCHCFFRDPVFS